jgi:hypothetical protein
MENFPSYIPSYGDELNNIKEVNYYLVRCNSHRARKKMYQAIGEQDPYFCWDNSIEYYWLSSSAAEIALEITGINKARHPGKLQKCITL